MKILHLVMFCSFSVVCVKTSAVLEVSGHVDGEVSIQCSVSWTKDNSSEHSNMYFCKGVCSRENILIQTERKRSAVTRRGRYSMEVDRGDGVFNVTMKKLKRSDAGRYCCGVGKTFSVLYQEINLIVLDASTVPPGSPPSTTTLQTEAETLPQGSSHSSTESSPAASTLPTTEKTNQQATVNLSDTTVVIIVSVSLALLVCAFIPLVFYGHWRSNAGESRHEVNKGEADFCEGNADGSSTQLTVRLQSLEPDPESVAQDASQYAAIYQALDPKALD
ncbi:CMRF35-like molecule 3 isoform X2 [Seriola lalandi dorsalis]|uniref:CMRF35-like molecule 3 isoform X2 n=1 Tax=Seriola lalandi dorsalis TaxID=1841481 RepID=UPI000C6F89DE|nr:CMRF35-like molecule 3 isoform X2 [Seriola lalandi dorsalis]